MQVVPVPPHTGTGRTGKENEMSIISCEHDLGKTKITVNGKAADVFALFAVLHEDLREKFKNAGMLKEFDAAVDEIIRTTREGV